MKTHTIANWAWKSRSTTSCGLSVERITTAQGFIQTASPLRIVKARTGPTCKNCQKVINQPGHDKSQI